MKNGLDTWLFSASWPTVVAICVTVAATMFAASWVGRERAKQSVECVKAGGEWKDSECVKGTKNVQK